LHTTQIRTPLRTSRGRTVTHGAGGPSPAAAGAAAVRRVRSARLDPLDPFRSFRSTRSAPLHTVRRAPRPARPRSFGGPAGRPPPYRRARAQASHPIGDNGGVICAACREHRHGECRGGSWCDCQHLAVPATPERRRRDEAADSRDAAAPDRTDAPPAGEPRVNWRRQG